MRDQDSMRRSIQDLTGIKAQQEARIKELEGQVTSATPPGDMGAEDYLTGSQVKEVARKEAEATWDAREKAQRAQYEAQAALEQERATWLNRAAEEIPESVDKNSPVYKRASELFNDPKEGLSRTVNGALVPVYPNAEYVAFSRAKLLVSSTAQAGADKRTGASFASAGGPSSTGAAASSTGDLSDEEFLKLSEEERVRYQERRFLEKHGHSPRE